MKQKKSKVSKSQVDVIVDCDDTVCLTCGEFYRDSAPGESGYNAMSVKIGHTKTVPISWIRISSYVMIVKISQTDIGSTFATSNETFIMLFF